MMLTLQLPAYLGGRRPVVSVEKHAHCSEFGHMWHVTLADGTSTFAFGDEIRVAA